MRFVGAPGQEAVAVKNLQLFFLKLFTNTYNPI